MITWMWWKITRKTNLYFERKYLGTKQNVIRMEHWNYKPIHKKGDRENWTQHQNSCKPNYRKMKTCTKKIILGDDQNGFRPRRSTINAIHTTEPEFQILWEHKKDFYVIFTDFRIAFYSVNRTRSTENL